MKTWKSAAKMMEFEITHVKQQKRKLPKLIANEAVNHYTLNFTRGGFKNKVTVPWRPRKHYNAETDAGRGILIGSKSLKRNTDPGRGVLIGKGSGKKLSRSIVKKRVTMKSVLVGSNVKYAPVHNYGLMSGRKAAPFKMPKRQFIGRSTYLNTKIRKLILKRMTPK